VADALVAKLSRTLGLDIKGVGIDKPLYEYGVDSLSALEIKNWWKGAGCKCQRGRAGRAGGGQDQV
jgi:aryl carrier-like protein